MGNSLVMRIKTTQVPRNGMTSKVETYEVVADEAVVVMTAMETWKERRASHNRF
jgi:hypothetical protein